MSDPMVRHLARELAAMRARIRAMEVASQAAFRSIEGGSIDVYDDETDELLGRIGVQKDGSIGVDIKSGKKPEAPTEPDVQPIPGGAVVAWDGRFEDRQSALVIDRVAVHMDETPGFVADRDTEVAAVRSTGAGGTAVIPIDDGADWYVKLVAVSKGGVWSDPSTEVHVAAVDANVAFYQDEFTLTAVGAQDLYLTFKPISFSEHLYWNGLYQREDTAWTREGQIISLTGQPFPARVGDRVVVEYAYVDDDQALFGWESPGWRYLQTSQTGTTDRSAVAFDDSSWSIGQAPFGRGAHTVGGVWPTPRIDWPVQTALWIRHDVPASAGQAGTIDVRIDNIADVYWNGEKLGTIGAETAPSTAGSVNVPAAKVLANNVLAIRAQDDVQQLSGDVTYIDARFTQA